MGSVRNRRESNCLFFDFQYLGKRCREQTTLKNSAANRKKMKQVLSRIEVEISLGGFKYRSYFPNSKMLEIVEPIESGHHTENPVFETFTNEWFDEYKIQWKESTANTVAVNIRVHIIPAFKGRRIISITKSDILKFRSLLANRPGLSDKSLSASRVNHVMTTLRQILSEASDRYKFDSPFRRIKPLKVPKTSIDPMSLDDVKLFLDTTHNLYRNYYTVRFFTGLRSCEIDGLRWRYVDLDRKIIQVRETRVESRLETPKTAESEREIQLNSIALEAMKEQFQKTGNNLEGFVFVNTKGRPIERRNMRKRIWYPTLEKAGLRPRRPYQTRHTTATFWLASGEAPEWIARQMGHTSTEMLFRVYSRFVPNLTRQDGSAFERLLASNYCHAPETNPKEKAYDHHQ